MLEAYIDFVKALFPSISPYVQENAKQSVRQFYYRRSEFPCFAANDFEVLSQGDIVSGINFRRINDEGEEEAFLTDGLVISNTCDIDHDNQVLIAPFFPIEQLTGINADTLKNNMIYSLLYFPDVRYSKNVGDLSLMSPFPKKRVLEKLECGDIKRLFSLNVVGYYLLISKITVHLLRPEDAEIQKKRKI